MIVYLLEMIDQEIFKDGSFLVSLEVFFMISEILIHDTFQGEIKHSNIPKDDFSSFAGFRIGSRKFTYSIRSW